MGVDDGTRGGRAGGRCRRRLVPLADEEHGSPEEFCALLADRGRYANVVEGFDPSDVTRSLDQLELARVHLQELWDAAPSEIRDDLAVQVDAVERMIQALEAVDADDSVAAVEALREAQGEFGDVRRSAANLERWSAENCPAVDPDPDEEAPPAGAEQ
jgi:hypothetical protein